MINTHCSGWSRALGVPTVVMLGMLLVAGTFTAPAASAAPVGAKAATNDRRVAEGVTLTTWRVKAAKSGPTVVVRAVTIDPSESNGRLLVVRKERPTRTSTLTKSVGGLVGINGSFFAGGRPRGLTLSGGKVYSRPSGYAAERTLFVGAKSLRIGSPSSGTGAASAITGRFQLLSGGEVAVRDGNRRLFQRHPRTFAGTTADGRIVLATVAGGATLREAGRIAQGLCMGEAINLDGGGSSSMVVNGRLINRSGERAVADALVWKVSRSATGARSGKARGGSGGGSWGGAWGW